MLRLIIVVILSPLMLLGAGENPSLNYIEQYKEVAISEMHRTGIPASIKMAQALLESGAGKSTLAREANNHFGIKCGGSWEGEEFYREDDDYKNGKLIKSCFRKFRNSTESFIAHSEFLTKQRRYAFLFDYKKEDYRAWAHGLKKAGYATDKKYPKKLIEIIEKYDLDQLDLGWMPPPAYVQEKDNVTPSFEKVSDAEATTAMKKYRGTHNDVAGVESNISNETPSRNRSSSEAIYHVVRKGQNLAEIAVIYGIEENGIRLRNRLPKDAEPLPGEKIFLRKKISLLNRPQFTRIPDGAIAHNEDYIF